MHRSSQATDRTGAARNADASIGVVFGGNNWTASNMIAGASAGSDGLFGTEDDALIPGGNLVVARIASIAIKNVAAGTEAAGDRFGFVAQEIAAFKVAGIKLPLNPGASNDPGGPVGSTGDVHAREVV